MDWNSLPNLSTAKEKQLRKLGSRKHRRGQGLFVAEGVRLVEEALAAGAGIEWAVAADTDQPRTVELIGRLVEATNVYRANSHALAKLLDAATPQPVAAVCRIPDRALDSLKIHDQSLLVICDSLRDPGNFGSIVRTSAAAGCCAVITAGNGVDPWNPKAVRGSMGALFRIPVVECGTRDELAGFLGEHGISLYLAEMSGEDVFAVECFPDRCALVLGGEAEGAGDTLDGLDYKSLAVPMAPGAESLNVSVAAGIMIYQVSRRLGGRRAN